MEQGLAQLKKGKTLSQMKNKGIGQKMVKIIWTELALEDLYEIDVTFSPRISRYNAGVIAV